MNSLQQQVETIRKAIEDKTGKCESMESTEHATFYWKTETGMKRGIVSRALLELLPLCPNKEGWIAVEEVAKLKYELYRALEALAHMYSQYCSPPAGHAFMSAGEDADEVLLYHGLTMNDDGQSSEIDWGKLYEIRQFTPSPPTRNTCQTCGKEITGSGYCSKECSNEGFKKDEI